MNKITFTLLLFLSSSVFASKPLTDLLIVPEANRMVAPEFVTENFSSGEAGLNDYKGKVVLLHFFATWCLPCREEMVGMENLWRKYKEKDFVVVVVSHGTDTKLNVEKFINGLDLSFPILLDVKGEVNSKYEVSRVPTTFLIDAKGKIISRVAGAKDWESTQGIQLVEELLSENL